MKEGMRERGGDGGNRNGQISGGEIEEMDESRE